MATQFKSVTAQPVDASHLTGISYAAVETTVYVNQRGKLVGMANDGNGRSTSVTGIDASLGTVHRHLQVLAAHHAGHSVANYVPGYLDPGRLDDLRVQGSRLVWVLQ